MAQQLAFDFGTTNSVLARWNKASDRAEIIAIPGLNTDQGDGSRFLIPTLLYVQNGQSAQIVIGQAVRDLGLDRQDDHRLFRNLKRSIAAGLVQEPRVIDGARWTDQEAGQHFLHRLVRMIPFPLEEIEQMAITVPVAALDGYPAWLSKALPPPLPARTYVVDESTAAALGYAVTEPGAIVLILDFGGGSLDISLVRLPEGLGRTGRLLRRWPKHKSNIQNAAHVIAKYGVSLGGSDIDQWLLSEVLNRAGHLRQDAGNNYVALLVACEQAKMSLSTADATMVEWQDEDGQRYAIPIRRAEVEALMEKNGFYITLRQAVDHVLTTARRNGVFRKDVHHVLLIGGTSLVPSVQRVLQGIFPDTAVRVEKPFTAVAEGALRVVTGLGLDDCLAHSYGLRYLDVETGTHRYDEIIPAGSRYPTKRAVRVSLGAAHRDQSAIEFVIGQISADTALLVEAQCTGGEVAWVAQAGQTVQQIVPLNAQDTALMAHLSPPGTPGEERLQVGFRVDAQRQLRVTAVDLRTRRKLLHDAIVVALGETPAAPGPSEVTMPGAASCPVGLHLTAHEPQLSSFQRPSRSGFSLRGLASRLNLLPPESISLGVVAAALNSPNCMDRFSAADMLSRRGDREARQILQDVLKKGTAPARASVVRELYRFSWFVAEPLIREALADADDGVRESAIYALCKIRVHEAYQLIMDVLLHESDSMRQAAVLALNDGADATAENLSRMWRWDENIHQRSAGPGVGAVPILEIALQAQDPDVRVAALEALGATQTPEAIPVVRPALVDMDPRVKHTAALSMLELAREDCLSELAGWIEQACGPERVPILRALFRATNCLIVHIAPSPAAERVIDALETALHDDLPEARMVAAMLLATMQHDRAAAVLREGYYREQDSQVKARILLAAESFRSAASDELLREALASQDSLAQKTAE